MDANQPSIVSALRAVYASVQYMHYIGDGCPDLLVGFRGRNFILEVKDGNLPPSRQALNEEQAMWHGAWRGQVNVVTTPEEALAVIGVKAKRVTPWVTPASTSTH